LHSPASADDVGRSQGVTAIPDRGRFCEDV
jgi:hypothetical protein